MNDDGKARIRILAAIAFAIGLLVAAAHWGRPVYRHFKEKHSAAEARAFFAKGDYRNALLSARQALLINSNNVPACRIMAELNDSAHSPSTLDWWRRVVELSPTTANKLALASTGLRYQRPPFPLTSEMLDDLSNSAVRNPEFHIVSAELALALRHTAEAETQFEAACKLEPTNRLFQLNLAVIRLASTNVATAADARARLKQFCSDPNLGPAALRSLIADRLLHDDAPGALGYSRQLLASPQANLSDRLQHLVILKRLQSQELTGQLKSLEETSATNAPMVARVASWMAANGLSAQATEWLNHLPDNLQSQPPVRLALVECYLADENWKALRDFTSKGSWNEMDFLRMAFLSRAWGKLNEPVMADGDWDSAVSLAGDRLGALNALLQLADRWNLKREQEDLLWRILRRFPDAGWAQHDLELIYFTAGNTRGLYRLYSERLPVSPNNVELKNNLTFTALLLKTNLNSACQWAAEIYARKPDDPAIASTYAYALYLQGRDRDGLAVMQKLNRAVLEQPSVALYYGVLLSATGRTNKATPYLEIAQTKGRLLPEEKKLLAETMK